MERLECPMKQYEIEIKFDPREPEDKWPWVWTVRDPESRNHVFVIYASREHRERTAIRRAEKAARNLVKRDQLRESSGNRKYLYPEFTREV
jgi:hypothetical protein